MFNYFGMKSEHISNLYLESIGEMTFEPVKSDCVKPWFETPSGGSTSFERLLRLKEPEFCFSNHLLLVDVLVSLLLVVLLVVVLVSLLLVLVLLCVP